MDAMQRTPFFQYLGTESLFVQFFKENGYQWHIVHILGHLQIAAFAMWPNDLVDLIGVPCDYDCIYLVAS